MSGSKPSRSDNNDGREVDTRHARLSGFARTGRFSDITLVVGPDELEIPASRILLASASDVLEAMLASNMQEGQPNAKIIAPDLDPKGAHAIISFAYTGEAEVSLDALVPAFLAARKYEVLPLRDACLGRIRNMDDANAALTIMEVAVRCGDAELRGICSACPAFGRDSIEQALSAESFKCLSLAGVRELLSLESCRSLASQTVWEACKSWAAVASCKEASRTLAELVPLLPVCDLPYGYLASLHEEGIVPKSHVVAALHALDRALSLVGRWLYMENHSYTIALARDGRLTFDEVNPGIGPVTGKLKLEGEWYVAELGCGMLRLKLEGDSIRSQFRKSAGSPWPEGHVATRRQ